MPATLTPCLLRVCRSVNPLRRLVILLVLAALVPAVCAATATKRNYDLASGDAATTLRHYTEQSGEQVVYVVPRVRGVTTNAVKGEFTACEVLDRMVLNTGLVVVQDEKTGAFLIKRVTPAAPPPSSSNQAPVTKTPTTMPPRNFLMRLAATLTVLAAPLAEAQTASANASVATAKSEAVLLTPFEVSTDKDVGYVAANSLAGGRADTPLKLTPASISVMTQEFMDDFNITNITEAINWTVNVQMRDQSAIDASPFGQFEVNFRNAGGSQGIPTRNYFRFYFNSDSYNTERLEFARGPNSLLFGDANMGGILGQLTKMARFNARRVETRFQVDSFGGFRNTADVSYGFDRFALRVNTVFQRLKPYQDGTFTSNEGIHVAASFKVSANTQLRTEGEWNATRASIYQRTYPENASYWNRTTFNENNTALLAATATAAGLEQISATNSYLVYNLGMPQNGIMDYRTTQYRTRGTGFRMPWEGRTDIPNFGRLPSKDFRLGPADAKSERILNTWSAYLDHRVTENWFAQLAYQGVVYGPITPVTEGAGNDYRIDVNKLLPDGRPNPNVGKAYADVNQSKQYQENLQKDVRFLTTFKFARPKVFGLNLDLKQRFSVIGGYRFDRFELTNSAIRWVNNPAVPNPTDNRNRINYRIYWDQPLPSLTSQLPVIPGATFAEVETGNPTFSQRQLYYAQFASTTTFFNDRLSLIAGMRRDEIEFDTVQGIGSDPVTGKFIIGNTNPKTGLNEPGFHLISTPKATTKNIGAVFYILPSVGLNFNYSTNFAPAVSGANRIDGSAPPSPQGTGRDFGLKFSFLDGRIYATASYYDTKQIGAITGGANIQQLNRIWTNLGYNDPEHTNIQYRDITSFTAQGLEFELTANLTRNFRMTVNHSRPKRNLLESNAGLQGYYDLHLTTWKAGANTAIGTVLNGKTVQNPLQIAADIQTVADTLAGAQIGVLADGTLKSSTNLAGTYSFREGKLKGFSIGGGAQFRGARKQGSRDAQLKYNTTAPNVQQNHDAAFDYLYVPSTTIVTAHVSYDYRFGRKIRARFQLNVANLLDDDSPQWTSYSTLGLNALPTGNPRIQVLSGFNQFDPRKFTLSTTFNF